MRSIWRTADSDILRDVAALAAAAGVVGASFGAIAVGSGVPWWLASAMSVVVFAGAAQFTVVAIVASGGGVLAAVLGGLLLNARHVPLGIAIGDVLGRRWLGRLLGSHLMTDESVAFALAQTTPARRHTAYWTTGLALLASWNVGVLIGAFAGQVIGDPAALGLDAAFPAALLALLLPSLRHPRG
ncbi:MAG: AzlC family ABC transporter permease, partial [Micromonosporaceae bacterium]